MKRGFHFLVVMGVSVALLCASSSPVRADETSDWNEWSALGTRLSDQKADVPTQAAQLKAYARTPGRMVLLSAIATVKMCETLRGAGQVEAAMSACDEGLAKWGENPEAISLVGEKAQLLVDQKKAGDAAALLPQYGAAFQSASTHWSANVVSEASLSLKSCIEAMMSAGQGAKAQSLLQKSLISMPVYLSEKKQGTPDGAWFSGWMWEGLGNSLTQSDKAEDKAAALGWAKARYALCDFDTKPLESATSSLSGAWAANDDFAAVQTFAKAQAAPAAGEAPIKNPLDGITLQLSAEDQETLQKSVADLESAQKAQFDDTKARQLILQELLLSTTQSKGSDGWKSAIRVALAQAKKVFALHPDQTENALEVCRVLKGADGNAVRANAFIAYLNGTGTNPTAELQKEVA